MKLMRKKKSLGQNFLTSRSVVEKIISTADLHTQDIVLEVGPGEGILTQSLLQKVRKVVSVEKDDRLISILQEKFKEEIKAKKLILVHGDILDFDFGSQGFLSGSYKIVANIPYYITGEFLRTTLSSDINPDKMVLLVQKEVAERIAKSKKESVLSVSVKVYGEPKYIQTVKAASFNPKPNVDSAILSINNISKEFFVDTDETHFFKVIKTGFAHKRKLLLNNLSVLAEKNVLEGIFDQLNLDKSIRAENVSLEQWKDIAQRL